MINTFIIPMQDLLYKGTEDRINEPATVKAQNWSIKAQKGDFTASAKSRLLKLTKQYNRI